MKVVYAAGAGKDQRQRLQEVICRFSKEEDMRAWIDRLTLLVPKWRLRPSVPDLLYRPPCQQQLQEVSRDIRAAALQLLTHRVFLRCCGVVKGYYRVFFFRCRLCAAELEAERVCAEARSDAEAATAAARGREGAQRLLLLLQKKVWGYFVLLQSQAEKQQLHQIQRQRFAAAVTSIENETQSVAAHIVYWRKRMLASVLSAAVSRQLASALLLLQLHRYMAVAQQKQQRSAAKALAEYLLPILQQHSLRPAFATLRTETRRLRKRDALLLKILQQQQRKGLTYAWRRLLLYTAARESLTAAEAAAETQLRQQDGGARLLGLTLRLLLYQRYVDFFFKLREASLSAVEQQQLDVCTNLQEVNRRLQVSFATVPMHRGLLLLEAVQQQHQRLLVVSAFAMLKHFAVSSRRRGAAARRLVSFYTRKTQSLALHTFLRFMHWSCNFSERNSKRRTAAALLAAAINNINLPLISAAWRMLLGGPLGMLRHNRMYRGLLLLNRLRVFLRLQVLQGVVYTLQLRVLATVAGAFQQLRSYASSSSLRLFSAAVGVSAGGGYQLSPRLQSAVLLYEDAEKRRRKIAADSLLLQSEQQQLRLPPAVAADTSVPVTSSFRSEGIQLPSVHDAAAAAAAVSASSAVGSSLFESASTPALHYGASSSSSPHAAASTGSAGWGHRMFLQQQQQVAAAGDEPWQRAAAADAAAARLRRLVAQSAEFLGEKKKKQQQQRVEHVDADAAAVAASWGWRSGSSAGEGDSVAASSVHEGLLQEQLLKEREKEHSCTAAEHPTSDVEEEAGVSAATAAAERRRRHREGSARMVTGEIVAAAPPVAILSTPMDHPLGRTPVSVSSSFPDAAEGGVRGRSTTAAGSTITERRTAVAAEDRLAAGTEVIKQKKEPDTDFPADALTWDYGVSSIETDVLLHSTISSPRSALRRIREREFSTAAAAAAAPASFDTPSPRSGRFAQQQPQDEMSLSFPDAAAAAAPAVPRCVAPPATILTSSSSYGEEAAEQQQPQFVSLLSDPRMYDYFEQQDKELDRLIARFSGGHKEGYASSSPAGVDSSPELLGDLTSRKSRPATAATAATAANAGQREKKMFPLCCARASRGRPRRVLVRHSKAAAAASAKQGGAEDKYSKNRQQTHRERTAVTDTSSNYDRVASPAWPFCLCDVPSVVCCSTSSEEGRNTDACSRSTEAVAAATATGDASAAVEAAAPERRKALVLRKGGNEEGTAGKTVVGVHTAAAAPPPPQIADMPYLRTISTQPSSSSTFECSSSSANGMTPLYGQQQHARSHVQFLRLPEQSFADRQQQDPRQQQQLREIHVRQQKTEQQQQQQRPSTTELLLPGPCDGRLSRRQEPVLRFTPAAEASPGSLSPAAGHVSYSSAANPRCRSLCRGLWQNCIGGGEGSSSVGSRENITRLLSRVPASREPETTTLQERQTSVGVGNVAPYVRNNTTTHSTPRIWQQQQQQYHTPYMAGYAATHSTPPAGSIGAPGCSSTVAACTSDEFSRRTMMDNSWIQRPHSQPFGRDYVSPPIFANVALPGSSSHAVTPAYRTFAAADALHNAEASPFAASLHSAQR